MSLCYKFKPRGATAGWTAAQGPLFPKGFRSCQDAFVRKEDGRYQMWFSWGDARLIAYSESGDGLRWEYPTIVLPALTGSSWEGHEVCRPCVVKHGGKYQMWYTGKMYPTEFSDAASCIGYAESNDGLNWQRWCEPVLRPQEAWEGRGTTYAHVIWDEDEQLYKMWYSAGEIREADAIGYAVSKDGITWKKFGQNPILTHRDGRYFEVSKVEGGCIVRQAGWYYLFYMGVDGDGITCIGVARSKDGVTGWVRHPSNPVYAATDGTQDWLGARGPSVMVDGDTVKMWYTGLNRLGRSIWIIEHPGASLAFDENAPDERGYGECHGEPNYGVNTCIARF
ncbi:MAG: family 43 glycosylhydrolase [Eubacteriales bacterium]|nr:family 43 glycosylhydrolase [Eubacteriales bacterium]